MKPGFLYIMASAKNGTLYIGATSDLVARAHQHREGAVAGFTERYGCKLLVWYEAHGSIDDARQRELQMKEWSGRGRCVGSRISIRTGMTSFRG